MHIECLLTHRAYVPFFWHLRWLFKLLCQKIRLFGDNSLSLAFSPMNKSLHIRRNFGFRSDLIKLFSIPSRDDLHQRRPWIVFIILLHPFSRHLCQGRLRWPSCQIADRSVTVCQPTKLLAFPHKKAAIYSRIYLRSPTATGHSTSLSLLPCNTADFWRD